MDGFVVSGDSKADIRKLDGHGVERLHTLLVQLLQHIHTLAVPVPAPLTGWKVFYSLP